MRDTDLYRHLLGLAQPWSVSRVELSVENHRVDVWAEHASSASFTCPECGKAASVYDHAAERSWRHLDSCQFQTYLRARPPRVKCDKHGVVQVRLPWAEPHSRFTLMFERFAIDVLKDCSVLGAARILGLSWDEAWHLMKRAVKRGQANQVHEPARKIGVDEKAIARGQRYMTLVCDLERATIRYVGNERTQQSLDGYFKQLSPEELAGIEAIAMDMWDPYFASVRAHVPNANDKVVYDLFHIMQYMGKALDTVRKREHRKLLSEGDGTLKGSKYLWLYASENLPDKHHARFQELRRADLQTSRAWALKENLRHLWSYARRGTAFAHWKRWRSWALRSRLQPVIAVTRMLERRLDNIMTFFTHRITNAMSESLNSKLQKVKLMAAGFRNPDNFKTAIYFHCGGLPLHPPIFQSTH
jgi:transposase